MYCDGLGRVGAQRLLEHDQRARLEPRRRLGGRIGRQPAARLAERDHPAPGAGVLGERPLEPFGEGEGARRA